MIYLFRYSSTQVAFAILLRKRLELAHILILALWLRLRFCSGFRSGFCDIIVNLSRIYPTFSLQENHRNLPVGRYYYIYYYIIGR